MDETVWVPTVFSKNRERLMNGDVAEKFFAEVLAKADTAELTSDEHFSVDGTLIEAWASQKSFQRKDRTESAPPDDPGIRRSTFTANSAATIRMNQRQIWKHGWRAKAAGMNRSWPTAEIC